MTRKAKKPETKSAKRLTWLLGQPHLSDYLDFVANKVVDGKERDPRALAQQWRDANDVYAELEASEAGIADAIRCKKLPKRLKPLAEEICANPWFRAAFDNLPFSFVRVELDRLVVSQTHVETSFSTRLIDELGADPDEERLFRFCLPTACEPAPVRIQRLSGDRFLLSSPSSDFRDHKPRLFRAEELSGVTGSGPIAAVVGLPVGFGSNFLSGIRSGKRILLQNGYHRAYSLRRAGFSHAYCIVEDVTRKDELKLTVDEEVAEDPEFYFAARRPPLLKDFFDPRLTAELEVLPMETVVEVEIRVRSSTATDWS